MSPFICRHETKLLNILLYVQLTTHYMEITVFMLGMLSNINIQGIGRDFQLKWDS